MDEGTRRVGAEEAAEAAIAAAELAVDYLGDLTTRIVNDAESARDEVREWRRAIENVSEEDLTEFVRKVAESSVLLDNADTDSRIIMADILEMTQLTIEELELNMGDTEAFKVAIQDAQLIFAVALEGAAESIGDLKLKVSQAQVEFRVVADLSLNIQTRINDNMTDRDAWLEARKASLRASAYGGCAACIACSVAAPVCCTVCYATAAGIVETKIKELEADVEASKTALTNLVARFGDIAEKADNLSYISEQTYEQMGLTERQLSSTANLAVKSDRVSLWKGVLSRNVTKAL